MSGSFIRPHRALLRTAALLLPVYSITGCILVQFFAAFSREISDTILIDLILIAFVLLSVTFLYLLPETRSSHHPASVFVLCTEYLFCSIGVVCGCLLVLNLLLRPQFSFMEEWIDCGRDGALFYTVFYLISRAFFVPEELPLLCLAVIAAGDFACLFHITVSRYLCRTAIVLFTAARCVDLSNYIGYSQRNFAAQMPFEPELSELSKILLLSIPLLILLLPLWCYTFSVPLKIIFSNDTAAHTALSKGEVL